MTFPADSHLQNALQKRTQQLALRKLYIQEGLIDFCSNDYLGFARSPLLQKAIEEEKSQLQFSGNGSGGSRLLAGNTVYAENLERSIASLHATAAGLIYNSGYDANVGLFAALGQTEATFLYDELIHASVHDGIKLARSSAYPFKHNDLFHLEERLKIATGVVYVAVESIYSMDGDKAPLQELVLLCEQYHANLIVDEAHATGITTNKGMGLVQLHKLEQKVFARIHTFGKALGCHGAIVVGSDLLRDFLINFSRSFIYTTALPIHSLIAIQRAYELMQRDSASVQRLNENIQLLKKGLRVNKNILLMESDTPIQSIVIPGNEQVKKYSQSLIGNGLDVRAILSPTVPKGKERLRICMHSFNSEKEISKLITCLQHIYEELG